MEAKNSKKISKMDLILQKLDRLGLIESSLNSIENKLKEHDKKFAGNEKLLEAIVAGLIRHDKQFDRMEVMFNKWFAKQTDIETKVNHLKLITTYDSDSVKEHEQRIEVHAQLLAEHEIRVCDLERKSKGLYSDTSGE